MVNPFLSDIPARPSKKRALLDAEDAFPATNSQPNHEKEVQNLSNLAKDLQSQVDHFKQENHSLRYELKELEKSMTTLNEDLIHVEKERDALAQKVRGHFVGCNQFICMF